MTPSVVPATSELEPGVVALFESLGVPIRPETWQRAFDPAGPSTMAAVPRAAVDASGRVLAYAAAHRCQLMLEGAPTDAQWITDLLHAPGVEGVDAAGALLHALLEDCELSLLGAAPPAATGALGGAGFLLSGWWTRWVCEPRTARREDDPTLPFELQPTGVFPPAIESLNQALLRRRLSFRLRTPEERAWMHLGHARDCEVLADATDSALDAYAVIRRVQGPRGTEDHLVDAACDPGQFPRLAAALRDLVAERRAPLFVSVFGDGFASALREAGFRQLRPRWNLRWRWRDPRQRSSTFVRRDAWLILPADAVLDYSM